MDTDPILSVIFFQMPSGQEPVREWLKSLEKDDRKTIGADIKLVQFRWPLGMPLVRKMEAGLWEVRSRLSSGQIARVMFTAKTVKWFFCMASSRNRKKHQLKIYNWHKNEGTYG